MKKFVGYEACTGLQYASDKQILSAITSSSTNLSHAFYTARMGSNISNGVIDGHARVFGVTSPRLVDAIRGGSQCRAI